MKTQASFIAADDIHSPLKHFYAKRSNFYVADSDK